MSYNYISRRTTNEFDYRYNDYESIRKFYRKGKTYSAVTYRYKTIDETKEIWLRIEVDYRLFWGFVLTENGENPGRLVLSDGVFDQEYFDNFVSDCIKQIGKFIY